MLHVAAGYAVNSRRGLSPTITARSFPIHFLVLSIAVRYAPRPLVCNWGLQLVPSIR